jgi:hypothetical protein
MSKSRWAATGLLGLVFALGALVGGAATTFADRNHHRSGHFGPHGSFVDFLKEELELNPEQENKVSAILERHAPAMDSIWGTIRPQFDAERLAIRGEIKALLSPAQIKSYDAMVARRDSMFNTRGMPHGSR